MSKDEALDLALEAHQAMREWIDAVPDDAALPTMPGCDRDWLDTVEANLKKALAAPVQEPEAWPCVIAEADFEKNTVTLEMQCSDYKVGAGRHWLHTTPPAQPAPVQEPVTLRPEDVTVEVLTVQGGGGFAPLRTHGVKLTHKPTGIVVQCSSERSQHRNREQALRDLERYLHGARPQPTPPAAQLTPVPQGSIQHLKTMMEESAWEGGLDLSDALANIDEFYATAQPAPVQEGSVSKGEYNRLRDEYNDLVNRSEQDAKVAKQWRKHVKYCQFQGVDLDYQITTPPAQPAPVQEPEYWNVLDPTGNVVASETDAIRGWARIAGSYKPTVEGLLGFHDQGWRVLPKVPPPAAQPAVPLTDEQKRDLIKKSALWDMHIHIGWYSAPAKSFVEKTIQLIADIEAAHGITKGQP